MLRRLGKWLRFMGYDTKYPEKGADDNRILHDCMENGLVLLTRDQELYSRYTRSILISSDNFKDQVRQVISSFPPDSRKYFTRCPECNAVLQVKADASDVQEVPEAILASGKEVWVCPDCGKVYWMGSHYDRIKEQVSKFEESLK